MLHVLQVGLQYCQNQKCNMFSKNSQGFYKFGYFFCEMSDKLYWGRVYRNSNLWHPIKICKNLQQCRKTFPHLLFKQNKFQDTFCCNILWHLFNVHTYINRFSPFATKFCNLSLYLTPLQKWLKSSLCVPLSFLSEDNGGLGGHCFSHVVLLDFTLPSQLWIQAQSRL